VIYIVTVTTVTCATTLCRGLAVVYTVDTGSQPNY